MYANIEVPRPRLGAAEPDSAVPFQNRDISQVEPRLSGSKLFSVRVSLMAYIGKHRIPPFFCTHVSELRLYTPSPPITIILPRTLHQSPQLQRLARKLKYLL